MPSSTKKQAKTMTAACKSAKFRKKIKIPKKVACDFHKADKGKYHEAVDIGEDVIAKKRKLAADIIAKSPGILDFLLDPKTSYRDYIAAKDEMQQALDGLYENMNPPQFLQVNKKLVELQLGWEDRNKKIARTKVFVDGKNVGKYYFNGNEYKIGENVFETVEEAIAFLMK